MMEFIADGGFFMYPLLLAAALVVVLAVRSGIRVRRASGPDPVLETGIDATLFWGGWALLLGLFGTFGGVYQASGMIARAQETSARLIWSGIRVALNTTLLGLAIFIVAALAWFGLRSWYRRVALAA
jgi:hypothetical protein